MKSVQPLKHIEALDGLRGVAILMVLCFHYSDWPQPTSAFGAAMLQIARSGWIGVDLFFVLSGFLITNVLLQAKPGKSYFRMFYARRALRLFPVYYLAVVLMFWVLMPLSHRPNILGGFFTRFPLGSPSFQEQLWYWINISNLYTAFYPLRIPFLTVFWSLAVEEQFYLVWPACVRFLTTKVLALCCFGCAVLIALLRNLPSVQAENRVYHDFIYRMTPFHMDGLFLGALLGILFHTRWNPRLANLLATISFPVTFTAVIFLFGWPQLGEKWLGKVAFSLIAVMFGALLWLCAAPGIARPLKCLFASPFLRSMGRYSYFIYVFHLWIITYFAVARDSYFKDVWPFNQGQFSSYAATVAVSFAAIYALGALSSRVFEGPIIRLKRHFKARPADALPAPHGQAIS